MPNVRTLRLTRGLTLTELALLVGIPARTLAEIEYGLRPLAPDSRCNLARIYDLQPDVLEAGRPGQLDDPRVPLAQMLGSTLVAGIWLTGTLAFITSPAAERPNVYRSGWLYDSIAPKERNVAPNPCISLRSFRIILRFWCYKDSVPPGPARAAAGAARVHHG